MTKDPVCGMTVEASRSAARSEVEGTTYYFCGPECQAQFDAKPRQFVAPRPQPARIPCCGFGMARHITQRGTA